jgi:hypothetical protein
VKLRAQIVVDIDLDLYPVPSDGRISDILNQDLEDLISEMNGVTLKKIIIKSEDFS